MNKEWMSNAVKKNKQDKKMPSHENIEEISIKTARLELILKSYISDIKRKDDWLAWLGVFVSLVSTFLFTDFNAVAGIDKSTIQYIYGFITFLSGFAMVKAIIARFRIKGKDSLDYLMDLILAKSLTPYELRLLFVLKKGSNENSKILVFWDELYECYMLPHCKNEAPYSEKMAKRKIAENLGLSMDMIDIDYYDTQLDKVSKKYSKYHKRNTIYYFSFCYVKIRNAPKEFYQESFEVDGRKFSWLSCQMLDHHENTRKKNSDVIRHISDNCSAFLYRKDSC